MPDTLDRAREHTRAYDDFRRQTGKDFAYLQSLHSKSLDGAVRGRAREFGGPPNVMVCDPDVLAYLTELALEHLAVGASMQEMRRAGSLRERNA